MAGDSSETHAIEMFETFHDRPFRRRVKFNFGWPKVFEEIGSAQAQMYRSNKWKKNAREFEDYKHIAEGPQRCFAIPGFLRDARTNKGIKTYGEEYEFPEPMPTHITILGKLIGVQVRLFDEKGKLPRGEENLFEVTIPYGMLAGARFPDNEEPFLAIYTQNEGVCMLIVGDELDIEKDGIVG